jgi:hypothetical protein
MYVRFPTGSFCYSFLFYYHKCNNDDRIKYVNGICLSSIPAPEYYLGEQFNGTLSNIPAPE